MGAARLSFAKLSTCMLDLAKPRVKGWWQRQGLQAARLSFAKSSRCSIWLNREWRGVVLANRGSQAHFCKTKHLHAQFGKIKVEGSCVHAEAREARPGFAKSSAYVLNLAKLRAEEREKPRWKGCVCRNEGSKPPPCCVKMKNTTARGCTPSCHVEMGRTQWGGACPSSLHAIVLLVILRKYAGAPCMPAFLLSMAPPPPCVVVMLACSIWQGCECRNEGGAASLGFAKPGTCVPNLAKPKLVLEGWGHGEIGRWQGCAEVCEGPGACLVGVPGHR